MASSRLVSGPQMIRPSGNSTPSSSSASELSSPTITRFVRPYSSSISSSSAALTHAPKCATTKLAHASFPAAASSAFFRVTKSRSASER